MESIASILAKLRIFSVLPEEDRQRIASVMAEGQIPAGETLFRMGDPGGAIFLVLDGFLQVVHDEGGTRELLRRVTSGQRACSMR